MKNNIQTSDILKGFMKRSNLTRKEVNEFTAAFQSVFQEALLKDKIVKISGLGTFKLLLVNARKSVDVRTGEAIEIAEHYKFSFTPSPTLRDQVNLPLAHLETVELTEELKGVSNTVDLETEDIIETDNEYVVENSDIDPMKKLASQAYEIQDLLSEIQGEVTEKEDNSLESDNFVAPLEDKESQEQETLSEKLHVTTNVDIEQDDNADQDRLRREESLRRVVESVNSENSNGGGIRHKWVWFVLLFTLLFAFLFLGLYTYTDVFDGLFNKCTVVSEEHSDDNLVVDADKIDVDTVSVHELDSVVYEFNANENLVDESVSVSIFEAQRTYTDLITTITVERGSRLTLLSLEFYGSKDYWVYIYEANRDLLTTPNNIEIGMKLRIPRLNPLLIDVQNEATISYAKSLQDAYISGS